jgi:hypothetical protein
VEDQSHVELFRPETHSIVWHHLVMKVDLTHVLIVGQYDVWDWDIYSRFFLSNLLTSATGCNVTKLDNRWTGQLSFHFTAVIALLPAWVSCLSKAPRLSFCSCLSSLNFSQAHSGKP